MKILLRAVLGLAVALLAVVTTTGAMQKANADGPNTDPAVLRAIKTQPWVELGPGDSDYRIASMRCYLVQLKFYNNCAPTTAGESWPNDFGPAVKKYQASHGLPQTGKLDVETWGALQRDGGEVGRNLNSGRTNQIKGIQYAMKVLQNRSLNADGAYGAKTEEAVKGFQERKEIDADGIFGPITFRAAFTKGAEDLRTPGR